MTNALALLLAAAVAAFLMLDLLVFDWGASLFAARKFLDLITSLAVWR